MSTDLGTARAAARLANALRAAGTSRPQASGAALGYVVEGDTPTLTVKLDSGQEVPQCMGELMPVGSRVLCFWVNEGHDLAVLQFDTGTEL